jgi:cytoskeletal protein RodZ
MIENFGSYLKHERELRGFSLEDIATKTKISIHFLQALENNQFDDLPEKVFIKGYIRSFARIIGSDEHEMLNAFDDTMDPPSSPETGGTLTKTKKCFQGKKTLLWLGLAVISLAGAVWATSFLSHKFSASSKKTVSESGGPEVSGNSSKPTAKSVKPNKISSQVSKGVDKVSKSTATQDTTSSLSTQTVAGNETAQSSSEMVSWPLTLTVKIQDDTWFNISVDRSREEDFVLPRGAEKNFYGKESFGMNIGDRDRVELLLNGQILILPEGGEGNMVRDFVINSKSLG